MKFTKTKQAFLLLSVCAASAASRRDDEKSYGSGSSPRRSGKIIQAPTNKGGAYLGLKTLVKAGMIQDGDWFQTSDRETDTGFCTGEWGKICAIIPVGWEKVISKDGAHPDRPLDQGFTEKKINGKTFYYHEGEMITVPLDPQKRPCHKKPGDNSIYINKATGVSDWKKPVYDRKEDPHEIWVFWYHRRYDGTHGSNSRVMAICRTDPRDDESAFKRHLQKFPMNQRLLQSFLMLGVGDKVRRFQSVLKGSLQGEWGSIVKIVRNKEGTANEVSVVWGGENKPKRAAKKAKKAKPASTKVDSTNSCRIMDYERVTSLNAEHTASRAKHNRVKVDHDACDTKRKQLKAEYAKKYDL